ncbi:MAG TPA: 2Fe-2S iron-sulfur cluster-binding protein [Phenylobacterium sp.]|nr:2Fe-2S iron-sulfur cluster-binding protein [Phenylobacterium sp.]
MVQVRFRRADAEGDEGAEAVIDAVSGASLMAAAKAHGVAGIEAICGGSMACGTCHVYVDETWFDQLPAASPDEQEMVACGLDPRPTSRLACQIVVTPELDGLVVTTPVAQL